MYPQIAISSNLDYMISTITMTNLLLLEHDKPLNQNLKVSNSDSNLFIIIIEVILVAY